jgi:hypothetical protein
MTETITLEEIGMLLALAAARDQRTVGDADVLSWHADLNRAQIDFPDAQNAVTHFYAVEQPKIPREQRFRVTAVDVIDIARKLREDRLANYQYEPMPGETGDDVLGTINRLRTEQAAIASGAAPTPTGTPALTGGPHPTVAAAIDGTLRIVEPLEDPNHPPQYTPEIAASRSAQILATVRRSGPLGQHCPKCNAPVGRPCRLDSGKQRSPHSARRAAAGAPGYEAPLSREQAAAEEARRRRAAATYLDGGVA